MNLLLLAHLAQIALAAPIAAPAPVAAPAPAPHHHHECPWQYSWDCDYWGNWGCMPEINICISTEAYSVTENICISISS
ncbi:hypothetical protein HDU98_010339 [Podochytrium sp. JEL0797]|nr:hypothetical protein HDU98_010339 [Podochytrium sp. JEL0797]